MSIQSEINRIKGNVDDTLSALSDAGVAVPAGANSDNLPELVNEAVNAVIPIERGGTNGTTRLEAANNLGVPAMYERTKIANGTDLNTITTVGNYCSDGYLSNTNLQNCPVDTPFIMNVYYACGNQWYFAQEIIDYMDGIRFFRLVTSRGTCYPWRKYHPNANLTPESIGAASKAELEEVKTSVSEGKALIASAVTDKGVETADNATFAQMAENIAAIPSGGGGSETITITVSALGPMGVEGTLYYTDGSGESKTMTTAGTVSATKGTYFLAVSGGGGISSTGTSAAIYSGYESRMWLASGDCTVKI